MKQTKSTSDMLKTAFSAQEDSGEGKVSNIIKADSNIIDKESVSLAAEKEMGNNITQKPVQEVNIDPQIVNIPGMPQQTQRKQFLQGSVDPSPQQMIQQPMAQPSTIAQPINHINNPTPQPQKHIEISNNEFDEAGINKVISILDKFRSLDLKVQGSAIQFVGLQKGESNLSKIIYHILNVEESNKTGLNDLVSLKKEDRPSRAFSLMSLDLTRLDEVNKLLLLFNQNYSSNQNSADKISYCKEIESGLETLDPLALKHLEPVNELLNI